MVLVTVVKASTPPPPQQQRRNEPFPYYQNEIRESRNFVPFHRNPSLDHQANLHWRNQPYITNSTNENELMLHSSPSTHTYTNTASLHQPEVNHRIPISYRRNLSHQEGTPEMPSNNPHFQHQPSPTPTFQHHHHSPAHTPDGKESKRWSFGGLFRRKEKVKSPSVPITIQFEPTQRPTPALPSPDSDSSPESEPRKNFLRRLSKKKKKSSGNGTKAVEGFLKVPPSVPSRTTNQFHRRSNPDFQSWETTKKCPPMLLSTNNNYSSSGSLSLSVEGSSSLSRGSRAAVKARAEARRESLLIDSSEDETAEEDLGSQSNVNGGTGTHSSLSLKGGSGNRRQKGRDSRSPSSTQHRVSNSSPNLNNAGNTPGKVPQSPRWEARIIYTQETLHEDSPVVMRLPKRRPPSRQNDLNGNPPYFETNTDNHNVITAGLRLPLSSISSSYPKSSEPIYANMARNQNQPTEASLTPPPPPRRDRQQNNIGLPASEFYRPVSCSYIDSAFNQQGGSDQPDHLSSHEQKIRIQNNPQFYDDFHQNKYPPHYKNNDNRREDWRRPQIKEAILTYDAEPRRYLGSPSSFSVTNNTKLPERTNRDVSTANVQQPIMSKLGFPVRKLSEKVMGGTHSGEFWNKREDINREKFRANNQSPSSFLNQQNPNRAGRIRSADSSPLSLPKHAKNPGPGVIPHGNVLHSTESISSLSSFSAETPSPNIFSKNNPHSLSSNNRSRMIKSPEFKISTHHKDFEQRSACERLNIKGYSSSPTPHKPLTHSQSTPPHPLFMQNGKSPGKNLEDALNELEDMYKSLRLSDEDLLDRAERRDLPTVHQQLREKDPIPFTSSRSFRFSPLGSGSLESLATTSGSGSTDTSRRQRARAPPLRRSGVPDRVNDDMAKRKYDAKESPKVRDPREVVGQSGSYLMFSPVFSPPASPCPGEQSYTRHHQDPDLIQDDVTNVNFRRANSIRIIDEPQPLFGVPLGPITKAPPSDYLHATPVEKYRPLFRHVKNPDVVKDDQAFRNLRKDLNQENNLSKDWTPRLFSPLRSSGTGESTDSVFNYNIQPDGVPTRKSKLRAVRSLSANISHLINPPCTSSALRAEIGKWNSFTDLQATNRTSRSLTPARTSNYLEPSWVEQANLEEYGTPLGASPNTTIQKKFKLLKSKPPQQPTPDPNAPRKPWTDIILESYKEPEEINQNGGTNQNEVEENQIASSISEEDNDVFLDALPTTPLRTPPKEDEEAIPSFSTKGLLLTGQKDRRGSYIDPRSPSLIPQTTDEAKRKSWSDTPKQFASFSSAYEAIAGGPKKIAFTPLPTPRRVRQISLEGFSSTANEQPSQSEQELNDLIDALVKEADTCGEPEPVVPVSLSPPSTSQETVPKKKRHSRQISAEKESKWQAAIAEIESSSSSPHHTPEPKKRPEKSQQHQHVPNSESDSPTFKYPVDSNEGNQSEMAKIDKIPQHQSDFQPQPHPRSILKKRPEEESPPKIKLGKVSKKTKCGINKNGCIPSWNLTAQLQSTSLDSSSSSPLNIQDMKNKNHEITYENDTSEPIVIGRFSIGQILKNGSKQTDTPQETKKCIPFQVSRVESNIEGMNGLRKLLNKDNLFKPEEVDKYSGIKNNNSSYWSRISSNQPSFLRRFFEKVQPNNPTIEKQNTNPSCDEDEPIETGVEAKPESILGMNVAQKATHFMKLEHSQRFSKWKVMDKEMAQMLDKSTKDERRSKNRGRYSTQPITTDEINELKKSEDDTSRKHIQKENKSDVEVQPKEEFNDGTKMEPSKLSLKDRVHMFNRLSSGPMTIHLNPTAVNSSTFRHAGSTPPTNNWYRGIPNSGSGSSQPKPGSQDVDSSYDNLTSFPLFRNHSTKDFQTTSNNIGIFQTSSSLPSASSIQKNTMKSLYLNNSRNNESQSEDGEVSSGGQEVSEIISKSYENSPLVRKKSWNTFNKKTIALPQNVWKKYGGGLEDNISHWSTTTDLPELFQFQSKCSSFAKVDRKAPVTTTTFPIKTSTSSLLPILTALSSSDDQLELDDPPKLRKPIETSKSKSLNSMANPSPPPRKKMIRKNSENAYSIITPITKNSKQT